MTRWKRVLILSADLTVMDFQGEGTYGQVIKCSNLHTSEVVAVKIHKQDQQSFMRELKVLEVVRALDPDKMNIVRFIEYFRSGSLHCMAFEMLDRSLCDLMDERNGLPLSLNEIRPVTHQLLVALEALNNIGIMHRDLKLDNIMLVNHKYEPFRIKVIDFGFALPIWQGMDPEIIQNLSVRAPEVNLGLPLSEAVDMWSVGCIMAHLYFGYSLFPFKCVYNWMETMLCLLGWPSHEMLIAESLCPWHCRLCTYMCTAVWFILLPVCNKENLTSGTSAKGNYCCITISEVSHVTSGLHGSSETCYDV
uniref:homeodomain-interacting protein kinase 1-like isoform X2 n=1 Tax=Solea senegalensis TaxID=28829 RepID=UPI001CD9014B|nr:homeodomain-interacting protein kinase 1-like isoform X2 [Solea senegalensis]